MSNRAISFFPVIVELTQNYLRLYLTHIADDSSDQTISETGRQLPKGLLIHCISGKRHARVYRSPVRFLGCTQLT